MGKGGEMKLRCSATSQGVIIRPSVLQANKKLVFVHTYGVDSLSPTLSLSRYAKASDKIRLH